jgi:hypothetical protein
LADDANIKKAQDTLQRVIDQDTEPDPEDPDGSGSRILQGVAPDRLISLSDPDMRHGRKSSSQRIDGYKRYTSLDLDSNLTVSACALPANVPEQKGADKMKGEIRDYGEIAELQIDRAFLASDLTLEVHSTGGTVISKPYSTPNGDLFSKDKFHIDLRAGTVQCPAGEKAPIAGSCAQFPSATCQACNCHSQCQKTDARAGRTISIHPNESLLQQLQEQVQTPDGRMRLRERTHVEHTLAHHCNRQGPRARYKGTRKNDFDARRTATVNNLFVIAKASKNGELLELAA